MMEFKLKSRELEADFFPLQRYKSPEYPDLRLQVTAINLEFGQFSVEK